MEDRMSMPGSIVSRPPRRRFPSLLAGALACTLGAVPVLAAPEIGDYTRFSQYESMQISPSGDRIAVTRRDEKTESLVVLELDSLQPITNSNFGRRTHIAGFFWVTDDRLLVEPAQYFPGLADGYVPTGEIVGIDADGGGVELLFGLRSRRTRPGSHIRAGEEVQLPGRVIDVLPEDDDHVIVQSMGWDYEGEYNRAYRMDVRGGRLVRLARSPIRNGDFVTDADNEVALLAGTNDAGYLDVYDLSAGADAEPVHRQGEDGGLLEPRSAWPEPAADGSPRFLVAERIEGDTLGLALWTPASGALESLARHPSVDVDSWLLDQTQRVYAVRFLDHFPTWYYPDPEHPLARLHAGLRAANPGDDVSIFNVTEDGARAVAYLHGPRRPGIYLVMDVPGLAVLRRLSTRPWQQREELAPMEPFAVEARAGTELRGYISEPPGRPSGPRPMVVLVHGGPHGIYDRWGFDPDVQLLVSRGYSVLQVNYRGSGGRGAAFERSGHGRWGAEMQDDVTDAVRWAIHSGAADPDRVCIMGGSYGAYAALTGAYREPDLYRCAIGSAGVYDLELMFERGDIRTAMKGQAYLERVLGEDKALLRAWSPVHNAERIRAAVLLAHGDLDERAPIEHALRMRRALTRAGNAPVWIRRRREGHGFYQEGNRREYWEEVLAFLDAHMGPGASAEPVEAPGP
jgi:dipeptidyl aminopeptidase/acylaminoacyl peptidase